MASKSNAAKGKSALPNVTAKTAAGKAMGKGKASTEQPNRRGTQSRAAPVKSSAAAVGDGKLPAINNKSKEKTEVSEKSTKSETPAAADAAVKPVPPTTSKPSLITAAGSSAEVTAVISAENTTTVEGSISKEATSSEATAANESPPSEGGVVSEVSNSSEAAAVNTEPELPPEPVNNNGVVTLIYERYDEKFPIVNGTTTQANIDEEYCLSFVMPDCLIHLSVYEPAVKRQREADGLYDDLFLREDPPGTYHGLVDDSTYYVYVEQQADQLARDQERMRRIAETMDGAAQRDANGEIIKPDDGRAMETCSCIYGNPCVDEYGCKDWTNRYAVAKKNGWKGF